MAFNFILLLSNIFDHIKIVMCVLKYNFIDKKSLKKQLNELVINKYLNIEVYHKYTIYNLIMENIMNDLNTNKNSNLFINKIITISRDTCLITAAFYNVTLFLLFLYRQ